jgi:regulator of sigma E protease
MFEVVAYIAIFLVSLTVLLVIHESGHFFVAKMAGVKVQEFGIGFPPRLWGFRYGETVYSLNLIPFGAFVRMLGEEDSTEPRSLAAKSAGSRLLIMAAGPAMNAVLAVFLFTLLFMFPRSVLVGDVVIKGVLHDSPAREAGILPGDTVIEVNGQALDSHRDLLFLIDLKLGTKMIWHVQRGSRIIPVELEPSFDLPGVQGADIIAENVLIKNVEPGSPAQLAGILPGDVVLKVGDEVIEEQVQLIRLVNREAGKLTSWTLQRGEENVSIQLASRVNPPAGEGPVGIVISTVNQRVVSRPERLWSEIAEGYASSSHAGVALSTLNLSAESRSFAPWTAFVMGIGQMGDILVVIKNSFIMWSSGGAPPEVAGPVGIGHMFVEIGRAPDVSWEARGLVFLQLTASISMVLALFNFLPIPALDGGRMLFVLIELLRRGKRIAPRKEGFVHMVGFVVLITFVLLVTFADISKLGDNLLGV